MRVVLFCLLFLGLAEAWSGNSNQLCSRERVKCVWERRCIYQTWMGCCAYGNFIVEIRYTEYFCCSGWRHNGNKACNIPICRGDCGGAVRGTCIAPDVCECNADYTGKYCSDIAECSSLRPCYPGYCVGSNCRCTNNFYPTGGTSTENCLSYPTGEIYEPVIEQSTVKLGYYHQVKQMIMYNMTIDSAMSPENVETFWTNRRDFNRLDFTFQSIYSPDALDLPIQPSYVQYFQLGVTEADISVIVTNLNSGSKYNKKLTCSGISRDDPENKELFRCDDSIDNFNTRFDSGDTYKVTFRAKNGGFRVLRNGDKQYYQGREARKIIEIKFDTDTPYHCSEKNECSDSTSTMMHITKDVTDTDIRIRWKGWKDQLSTIARYALEVFKLQPDGEGNLKEPYTDLIPNPVPLIITEFPETTEGAEHTFSYRPKDPGVYSWILEANDKANNSAYTRRFVIYDPVSTVTSDSSHRLYATSGNPRSDYNWQIQNPKTISLTWKDHFVNTLHEEGQFLNRIRHFPDSLSDGGIRNGYKTIPDKYDDLEGKRTRNAIPNKRGIVKYDVAYYIGRNQLNPPSYQNQSIAESSINISLSQELRDGDSVSVWVKAYDILGKSKVERILVHYDSSPPNAQDPTLWKNVGDNKMDFSSRLQILGATDPNSGVNRIKYRFFAKSTGALINNREYEYKNPVRDVNYCNRFPCDENLPSGNSFGRTIQLDFDNCHAMNVSNVATETVTMELDIYNSAGLFIQKSIEIYNLTTLRGVNDYFGPMNVRIAEVVSPTSIKIMWEQAPSCYNIQGINFTYTKADGTDEKAFLIHKNNPWHTMSNLEPGAKYIIRLYTLYGDDESNPIRSEATLFSTNIPQRLTDDGPSTGAVAGGVVGGIVIIIILVLIFLIFMVKTRRMSNPIDRFRSSPQQTSSYIDNEFEPIGGVTRRNNSSLPKAYGNRAYSQEFDDDVYYAENETPLRYQIMRHRITFEEEITRGKFAIIYKAKFMRDSSTTVVAKTMKENPSKADIETMHAKVNFYTMKVGEHPNVLKFIGVVDDDVLGRFMILEYCENGTLKEYLKSNRHKVNEDMHEKLYRFACGICKGMNYLASQGVVHRRLAARNVLLTFLLETKITGFGPEPRDNESDGDNKSERIPIKWMAPECIKTTKYATEKSDVWSYGVVLWEIFSMGEAPYEGIKSVELDSRLKRGERLKKPEHCDDTFYKIMKKCWSYESKKRPNFEEIVDQLQTLFTGNIDGDDYYYSRQGLYDNRK